MIHATATRLFPRFDYCISLVPNWRRYETRWGIHRYTQNGTREYDALFGPVRVQVSIEGK